MKKIYSFILIAVFISASNLFAQAPNWQWATSASGGGDLETHAVAADHAGNVFVTGWYYNSAPVFGSYTLPYSADGDIFLVKYDGAGNVLWAQGAGSTGFDEARSIAVDDWGNVVVTGVYDSPSLTIGSTTLVNAGTGTIDIFIAKFDSSGNVLWAKGVGGVEREFAEGIAVDYAGNVFISGSFEGASISFDGIPVNNVNPATEDIFIAKYDPSGTALWAKAGNGSSLEWATCVATDPYGNVFIAGPAYSDTLNFDTFSLVWPAPFASNEQMFIVRYDPSGNVSWASPVTGNGVFNELYSLATDAFGNLFVTGCVNSDTVLLGSFVLTNPTAGYNDILLAKYDSAGNAQWAKKAGGYGSDYGYSVATDASGNVYLTGYFDSDTMFIDAAYVTVNQNYYSDLFIAKADGAGNVLWIKSTGGIYQPLSFGYAQQGTCLNDSGDVFTAGSFAYYDTLFFDAATLFLNGSGANVYLAKMNDGGACSASFAVYPDSITPHLYWILNQASGIQPISYLWNWGDGSTDTTAYPSHTYAVEGFYTICLTITDSSGCSNAVCHTWDLQRNENTMVQVNVVGSIPVGMQENSFEETLLIYPNPAGDRFTIHNLRCDALSLSKCTIEEVIIYNSMGILVYNVFPKSKQFTIGSDALSLSNGRHFAPGIYFVKVKTEKVWYVKKLIIN